MDELEQRMQNFADFLANPKNVLRGKVSKLLTLVAAGGFERDIALGRFEHWIREASDEDVKSVLRILRE